MKNVHLLKRMIWSYLKDLHEFESESEQSCFSVRGSLKKYISEWEKLSPPDHIISLIKDGYKLPFVSLPPSKLVSNNKNKITGLFENIGFTSII